MKNKAEIERLKQKLADCQNDYMRRHKEASDHFESDADAR